MSTKAKKMVPGERYNEYPVVLKVWRRPKSSGVWLSSNPIRSLRCIWARTTGQADQINDKVV